MKIYDIFGFNGLITTREMIFYNAIWMDAEKTLKM